MKKIILTLVIAMIASCTAMARKYTTTNVAELPAKAQTFLKANFKKGVNHINIDKKTFGGADYDVVLKDGTEIEFDADGSWESVDCGASAVPASVVPKAIATYVKNNYRGAKIVEIEVDRKGYDVKLSTGLELKFDRAGKILRID